MQTESSQLQMIPIKNYDRYLICKEGFIYDTKFKKFVDTYLNNGYKIIYLVNGCEREPFKHHRLVAQHFICNPDGSPFIDHIDRIRSNNSVENLRWVSCEQNSQNKTKKTNALSQYMGVTYCRRIKKWKAQISIKSKIKYIGSFASEIDAAKAYDLKALELGYLHHNGLIQTK